MKLLVRGLVLAGLLPAATAMAKPCTATSATGMWTLVSIKAAEPGVEDFYKTAPHEVMRFGRDGSFIYVASTGPITAADAGKRLDATDARDGTSYRFSIGTTGAMMLLREGQPFQAFQCDIADGPTGDARAGDMILTNAPGADMLRRVQRKLN
jgi:hypothetical protein